MVQALLPSEYTDLSPDETARRIRDRKAQLGPRLVILGHHYQRDEIIEHADFRGDSYKLAKDAAKHPEAEFIVFCGVHFMAESADILTGPEQTVILPNLAAGCSMADMANFFQVRKAWREIHETCARELAPVGSGAHGSREVAENLAQILPVTYINSAANLKAFVGEHGGTVCTSTNAPAAVRWALEHGQKVLFFPDQHLGRNTGVKLGYQPGRDMIVWDPFKPLGGNQHEAIRQATFILWKGHCSVHERFTVAQIEKARREAPGVQVVVHPECPLEVVLASDFNGSTEFIIRTIAGATPGSTWAVGTEINLVSRLAKEHPDKTIFCLDPQVCPCSTMYRIHPTFLLWVLDNLVEGRIVNEIRVPDQTRLWARQALDTMLAIPA